MVTGWARPLAGTHGSQTTNRDPTRCPGLVYCSVHVRAIRRKALTKITLNDLTRLIAVVALILDSGVANDHSKISCDVSDS